jgi:hypothetical protein
MLTVAVAMLCPAATAQSVTHFNASPGALAELTSKFLSPKAAIETQKHKIGPHTRFLPWEAFLDPVGPIAVPFSFAKFYLTSDLLYQKDERAHFMFLQNCKTSCFFPTKSILMPLPLPHSPSLHIV